MTNRTLSVICPAIPERLGQTALIPQKLIGHEGMNTLFDYQLVMTTPHTLTHLWSDAANFKREAFVGHIITVNIALDGNGVAQFGAGQRHINALITKATLLGEQARQTQYVLTLRPWLSLAQLRTNTRIFQDKTVIEILDDLLSDYPFSVDKQLIETYPKRDYQTQYNETDFQFLTRLCEEWGINYYFSHSEQQHQLVLIDNMGAHKKSPSRAFEKIQFLPPNQVTDEETIHQLMLSEKLTSGIYTARDYDYTRPQANLTATQTQVRDTQFNQQEVYTWHTDTHFSQPKAGPQKTSNDPHAEGDFIARRRMEALHAAGQCVQGQGALRGLVPGHIFTLVKHPCESANIDWLVLTTHIDLEEVASASSTQAQSFKVQTSFELVPSATMYRAPITCKKPNTNGPHVAVVTGPEGQTIWTDELGRIKVQFPWDRQGNRDEDSSCWIRVASPWAGNQMGAMHLPRIGNEVIVHFLGGDPDLPICTGRVYNQAQQPPWTLPSQHALSGFRSRELSTNASENSGRSNHLVMDDTEGKIQAQLRSDHAHSQLSLGHIARIETTSGRQDTRGEGFELRTDAQGVIRAKKGLFITSEGREGAHGKSADISETIQRLAAAQQQHQVMANGATHTAQQTVAAVLEQQLMDLKETPSTTHDTSAAIAQPHLLIASPAGIETSTAQSTHIASDQHTALTTGAHLSFSAGKSWVATIAEKWSVFVQRMDIVLRAAKGNITISAMQNAMTLDALKELKITSTDDSIIITAKKKVVINGAGSFSEWSANGITHGTNGQWTQHAAQHAANGPKSMGVNLQGQPAFHAYDETVRITTPSGKPLKGVRYQITGDQGVHVGITNQQGQTNTIHTQKQEALKCGLHFSAFKVTQKEDGAINQEGEE
jgi:type VI secretion system secreted protein VgrG